MRCKTKVEIEEYYYSKLDKSNRQIYTMLLSALEAYNNEISINFHLKENIDIAKVFTYLGYDYPSLFYVDFSRLDVHIIEQRAIIRTFFLYSEQESRELKVLLEDVVEEILKSDKCTDEDDYCKGLKINDYLVGNVSFNRSNWKNYNTVVGALLENKGACEAFAKSFKYLCDKIGLKCIYVRGVSSTAMGLSKQRDRENRNRESFGFGHSWNIVKLNGEYVHVDVTWNKTKRLGTNATHKYFNILDSDMSKEHCWDRALLPRCTSRRQDET
jgi:transglutaminase-like putative cysteine protease